MDTPANSGPVPISIIDTRRIEDIRERLGKGQDVTGIDVRFLLNRLDALKTGFTPATMRNPVPSPLWFAGESSADRFARIRQTLSLSKIVHHLDSQWLLDVLTEQNSALDWQTTCLSCSRVLDSSYADYASREQAEEKIRELEAEIETLRAAAEWTRKPKAFFETDFNVFRAGGRLTAYSDYPVDDVSPGDVVIVGAGDTAMLAKVHSTRVIPPHGFSKKARWAIEVEVSK